VSFHQQNIKPQMQLQQQPAAAPQKLIAAMLYLDS